MPSAKPLGTPIEDTENFSLFLGGPLFQLLLRAHLTDDALMMMLVVDDCVGDYVDDD